MPLWTFASLITGMNTTMFNVTIPAIIQDLGVTADVGAWIVSSYSIGYALSTVLFSRLSDSVSIRILLIVGLLIMGGASVLGYYASDIQTLLAARILQSAGAGTISGLGLIIITRYIPYERRGRAISVISIGRALAFGFGPLLGGIISEYYEWHGLFAVTCLVLLVLPPLLYSLPKEQSKGLPFDLFGALLTILNAVSMLVAVSRKSIGILIIGVLSLILHKQFMRRSKNSFINPLLFEDSRYKKLYLIGFLMMMLNLGNLFLMPLALANLFGMSPMWIGGIIAPGAIFTAIVASFIGRWIDRFADLRFMMIGQCMVSVVLLIFSFFLHASEWIVLCGYLLFAPAFSSASACFSKEASRILPKSMIGAGMGLLQLCQLFGGAVSVAVCGILIALQPGVPLFTVYENVYKFLLAISLSALGVTMWYGHSRKQQLKHEGSRSFV